MASPEVAYIYQILTQEVTVGTIDPVSISRAYLSVCIRITFSAEKGWDMLDAIATSPDHHN